MVRIELMADRIFRLDRRELLAAMGAAAISPALSGIAAAQRRRPLTLVAKAGVIALRPGQPDTAIWSLQGAAPEPVFRFTRGDELEIGLENGLPVPTVLDWRGIDGVPTAEPLMTRSPLAPGAKENLVIPLPHAGTLLCDIRLLGDGQARPARPRALIVGESEPVNVDRDEVLLIEDWRLGPDGRAVTPGIDPKDATPLYTINGLASLDLTARRHERLRCRFINGCQRSVIAIKIEGYEVRVMALDGEPSEPFSARNGALVLAPGGRADAFIDASAPPGSISSILLHDGSEAHPIARLIVSHEPRRFGTRPCRRPRHCLPMACPPCSTSGMPSASM